MGNTYVEVLTRASTFLKAQGKDEHAIEYVFRARKQWSKTDLLLHLREVISPEDEAQIARDVKALLQNIPPQYLTGYEEFYGRRFQVTKATLIPRPETEELVDWCLKSEPREALAVTDIGTGSGAIAISLKLERPTWQVTAVDISTAALAVARENARHLKAEVEFVTSDVLRQVKQPQDVIISNPPYISSSEWALIDQSVREFEPKTALFAENNGLAIYQQIALQSQTCLKPAGQIFLEIGFQQGPAVKEIFQTAFPQKKVCVKKDLLGNDRMVRVFD